MRALRGILFGIIVSFLATACVPTTFTRTHMAWKPYAEGDNKQEKEGVIAELKFVTQVPESFFATVQACGQGGQPLVNRRGNAVVERVSFRQRGQFWELLALTNQTDHVIRMNQVAIRVFDPSGSQIEALTRDDLNAQLLSNRPCHSSQQAINQFRVIKVFDRNMEIVPGTTSTFWVAFAPPSMQMSGVWKFAIYEVPVKVDDSGRATKTTRFEMRVVATQTVDTYTRESPFAEPKLVDTKIDTPQPEGPGPQLTTPPPASQSSSPTRSLSSTKDTISRVQVELKARGFDPGSPDGSMGQKTREALLKFQNAHRLRGTGEIDTATLEALAVQ